MQEGSPKSPSADAHECKRTSDWTDALGRPHSATAGVARCAAGLVGADFSPGRFSRLASLLAWPNGETANCKQKSRKPLRKT